MWEVELRCPVSDVKRTPSPCTPSSGRADAADAAASAIIAATRTRFTSRLSADPLRAVNLVTLRLPVRDEDARDPDEDHRRDPYDAGPPVCGVRPAEPRQAERRGRAADQTADVTADRDVADRKREHEVEHDHSKSA